MRTVRYILPCGSRYDAANYLHKETILADYPIILLDGAEFYHPYGGLYTVKDCDLQSLTIECIRLTNTFHLESRSANTFSFSPEFLKNLQSVGIIYRLLGTNEDKEKTINEILLFPILLPVDAVFYTSTGQYKVSHYRATNFYKDHPDFEEFEFREWQPEYGRCTLYPICVCIKTREELELENPKSPLLKLDERYFAGTSTNGHSLTRWEKELLRERTK